MKKNDIGSLNVKKKTYIKWLFDDVESLNIFEADGFGDNWSLKSILLQLELHNSNLTGNFFWLCVEKATIFGIFFISFS